MKSHVISYIFIPFPANLHIFSYIYWTQDWPEMRMKRFSPASYSYFPCLFMRMPACKSIYPLKRSRPLIISDFIYEIGRDLMYGLNWARARDRRQPRDWSRAKLPSDRPLDRELIRKREVDPRKRPCGPAVFLIRQLHRKDGKIMADHRKTGLWPRS